MIIYLAGNVGGNGETGKARVDYFISHKVNRLLSFFDLFDDSQKSIMEFQQYTQLKEDKDGR